jgi:histidinol-phosphate/aromatic aminotransferase/cobyric acid decarboxylase-like protein
MRVDRKAYQEFFDRQSGFQSFKSDANFVLVKIPANIKEQLRKFLAGRGIAVKFFAEPEFSSCIRITLGTSEQNKKTLSALADFLQSAHGSGDKR